MIKPNSGKIYRFQLEHNQGFGFVEMYDFTDYSEFDGRVAYVFNRIDEKEHLNYNITEIHDSGIALGPIKMVKFPGTRGKYAAKYVGQNQDFLITKIPPTKELNAQIIDHSNWNNFQYWRRSDEEKQSIKFIPYSELRNLETNILNSILSLSQKLTMKKLIDEDKNVANYYDLNEIGFYNMYVQLINTYYPLKKTQDLIKDLKNPYKINQ